MRMPRAGHSHITTFPFPFSGVVLVMPLSLCVFTIICFLFLFLFHLFVYYIILYFRDFEAYQISSNKISCKVIIFKQSREIYKYSNIQCGEHTCINSNIVNTYVIFAIFSNHNFSCYFFQKKSLFKSVFIRLFICYFVKKNHILLDKFGIFHCFIKKKKLTTFQ